MISVRLNKRDFEYDIHSLIKAFYPKEDVIVTVTQDPDQTQALSGAYGSREALRKAAQEGDQAGALREILGISVFYEKNAITITVTAPDRQAVSYVPCEEQPRAVSGSRTVSIDYEKDRRETKSALKRLLYEMLRDLSGEELPWGDLTGIRPTRIAMNGLRQGADEEKIVSFMKQQYYVSERKARLAFSIASREKAILERLDPDGNGQTARAANPVAGGGSSQNREADILKEREFDADRRTYSLYVGIPFCPSICLYCSFSSSPIGVWKDRVDDYLDALCREIDASSDIFRGRILTSIYIGGGTPTTLEPAQMDRLLGHLQERFDLSHLKEWTVEAGRPDSITRDKLQVLLDHGISRISINPQTMNQKTLDLIGRAHTTDQIRRTFEMARQMGFKNINMDLIIGLPGEGEEAVSYTMEQLSRMKPESVTVHALALKRAARLNLMKSFYEDISFQASDRIMDLTMNRCREMGLAPYYLYRQKNMAGNFENVGYAAPGFECLYNILIMEEVQSILALGAGASTKMVYKDGLIKRVENVKDIRGYISRIDEMIDRKRQMQLP